MAIGRNTFIEIWIEHPWQVVKGPVAALQCYLNDRGWDTTHYDRWTKQGANGEEDFELNMHASWLYIKEELQRAQVRERITNIDNAVRSSTTSRLDTMEEDGKSIQPKN